jgi:hypothetical protein
MSINNFVLRLNSLKNKDNIQTLTLKEIREKIEIIDTSSILETERSPKKKKRKKGKGNKSIRVVTWYSDESDDET